MESDEIARHGKPSQSRERIEPDIHPRRVEHHSALAGTGALMRIEP